MPINRRVVQPKINGNKPRLNFQKLSVTPARAS